MPLIDPVTMSSSITKGAVAQAQAASKRKDVSLSTLQPVQVRQTAVAQTARHAFPALVAAVFLFQFSSLVADPVTAMRNSLPVVAALQIAYALLCLPVAGAPAPKPARKARPGEKKKPSEGSVGQNGFVTALLSLLLAVLVAPFFHVAMILFGAPFLTHGAQTFLCALHLAILGVFPLFYAHGVDATAWAAVAGFQAPLDETFGGLVGALVGAWLGAVPIPLDWDREWQKWPVTILCGIYGGYLLGRGLGGTLLFGKKF
ncbi:GPI biosynthesis protein family Pig-F-domain-containing protein [Podospora appendiculata]|uniref:GPI biosynthesis protein family Pig-F-domain-containing protein n=1 Tax=Podospora appendiculata TaxID=314037 RepID=A0AAE1CAL3_9PEZI|nr:GPI biosynthesis protein family Pig-F-domain-containing protein [Podospora appendiculata]